MTDSPNVLLPRKLMGRIDAVTTTSAKGRLGFQSELAQELVVDLEGIVGNRHRGWVRGADARVPYLPRGTPIRNERQVSIMSAEDLAVIAARLEIDRLDPRWIGANIIVSGIASFSFLPRGTRLMLPGKAILIITDQNAPCTLAGEAIAAHVPNRADIKLQFPKRARGLRGLVATIEHGGTIAPGMTVDARLPAQWTYPE